MPLLIFLHAVSGSDIRSVFTVAFFFSLEIVQNNTYSVRIGLHYSVGIHNFVADTALPGFCSAATQFMYRLELATKEGDRDRVHT